MLKRRRKLIRFSNKSERAHWVAFHFNMHDTIPQGGVCQSGFGGHPRGVTIKHSDIREIDLDQYGGLYIMGIVSVDQSTHTVLHPLQYVFDEHDLDVLDFPDQFGRPRLADGTLLPMAQTLMYVLVDSDTKEVLEQDPRPEDAIFWEAMGRTVHYEEWTPDSEPFEPTRRGSIGDEDLYGMTAQHKPLGETDDDSEADDSQEETSNE